METYTFRNLNNQDIVGVHYVVPASNDIICSGNDNMHVLTERIPTRFSNIQSLSQP